MKTSQGTLFAEDAAPPRPSTATLYHGDCLEVMPQIEAGSVNMMFADLPYATATRQVTINTWDVAFDMQSFWAAVKPLVGKTGWTVFTANFTHAAALYASNMKGFRHEIVWHRTGKLGNFFHAKHAPLRCHELILMFADKQGIYNPQKTLGKPYVENRERSRGVNYNGKDVKRVTINAGDRYPVSVLQIGRVNHATLHPTQKPVALLEWLIATYTNPGDTVLDPCFGSCTTGVACTRLGRNYIGIEKDPEYFRIGSERLAKERERLGLT